MANIPRLHYFVLMVLLSVNVVLSTDWVDSECHVLSSANYRPLNNENSIPDEVCKSEYEYAFKYQLDYLVAPGLITFFCQDDNVDIEAVNVQATITGVQVKVSAAIRIMPIYESSNVLRCTDVTAYAIDNSTILENKFTLHTRITSRYLTDCTVQLQMDPIDFYDVSYSSEVCPDGYKYNTTACMKIYDQPQPDFESGFWNDNGLLIGALGGTLCLVIIMIFIFIFRFRAKQRDTGLECEAGESCPERHPANNMQMLGLDNEAATVAQHEDFEESSGPSEDAHHELSSSVEDLYEQIVDPDDDTYDHINDIGED